MKKVWADKWIKALRSGKYKQGTSCLYDAKNKRYCCLGVLARVAGFRKLGGLGYLSAEMAGKCGLRSGDGQYGKKKDNMVSLAGDNDSETPFTIIAETIKKHWKEL